MGLYIIGNKTQRICKIGVSNIPGKRVSQIQTGCPYKVELLAFFDELGFESEREYHKRYKSAKMYGEWFRMTPEIISIVSDYEKQKGCSMPANSEVKEIPSISYEEYQKQTRSRKRRKNQVKYLKGVFNHK